MPSNWRHFIYVITWNISNRIAAHAKTRTEPAHSVRQLVVKHTDVSGVTRWEREAMVWNRWTDIVWKKKPHQKTDKISGAQTLKSSRGNIFQGKPSLGFSIQIKLRSYSLNTTSSWQLEAFPSICALISFQSQAEPDCHTKQVFADNTCTSSGGSQFSSFQTFQIEPHFFSVIVFSNLLTYPVICTKHLRTLTQ